MKKQLSILPTNSQGFTLIEVIAVLVLLGTVSAIVISKTGGLATGNAVIMEAEILKYNLRYAQMKAMNSKDGEIWQITFPDATSYKLQQRTGSWADKNLPGQTSETHEFEGRIRQTTDLDVRFNHWGTPVEDDNTTAENIDIILTDGTNSKTIRVTKNTGFTYLP